jgi:hypothetical protein
MPETEISMTYPASCNLHDGLVFIYSRHVRFHQPEISLQFRHLPLLYFHCLCFFAELIFLILHHLVVFAANFSFAAKRADHKIGGMLGLNADRIRQ